MKRTKNTLCAGMAAFALLFSLSVTGCGDDEPDPPPRIRLGEVIVTGIPDDEQYNGKYVILYGQGVPLITGAAAAPTREESPKGVLISNGTVTFQMYQKDESGVETGEKYTGNGEYSLNMAGYPTEDVSGTASFSTNSTLVTLSNGNADVPWSEFQ